MTKDLVSSSIARQNILNNTQAVLEIQNAVGITGIMFEGEYKFLKRQVADFFDVTERTIKICITKNREELSKNGYESLTGKRLNLFKLSSQNSFGREVYFPTKTTVLGIFNFRAFLNIAMLLSNSEKAKQLRNVMLDITIDFINRRTGGSAKYIN